MENSNAVTDTDDRKIRAIHAFFITSTIFSLLVFAFTFCNSPSVKSISSANYHNIVNTYITETQRPAFNIYLSKHRNLLIVSSERPDVVFSLKIDGTNYAPSGKIFSVKVSPKNDFNETQTRTNSGQIFFNQDAFIRSIEKRGAIAEKACNDLKLGEKKMFFYSFKPVS